MKFVRYREDGIVPGVVVGDHVVDLRSVTGDIDSGLFGGSLDAVRDGHRIGIAAEPTAGRPRPRRAHRDPRQDRLHRSQLPRPCRGDRLRDPGRAGGLHEGSRPRSSAPSTMCSSRGSRSRRIGRSSSASSSAGPRATSTRRPSPPRRSRATCSRTTSRSANSRSSAADSGTRARAARPSTRSAPTS